MSLIHDVDEEDEERERRCVAQVRPVADKVGHAGQEQHAQRVEEARHDRDESAVRRPDQLQSCV